MPKRRDLVSMSQEEQRDFIGQRKSVQVATIQRDGAPHLTTLWFALDEDHHIVMETFTKSQKIKNLERDPRITILFEDGLEYDQLRGVVIYGRAQLLKDPAEVEKYSLMVLRRNNKDIAVEDLRQASQLRAHKKTIIRVVPGRVNSWDHRKLGGIY